MPSVKDYRGEKPTWCPGCGDFAVLAALQQACVALGLEPHRVCVVSGIGCSGKLSQHIASYGFHGLHGRAIPLATGVKLANQELTVIAAGGDGDGYGIGLSHTLHAMRRNIDITYIVMDNNIYGLTTGQTSPTSRKGFKSKTSPLGAAEDPIHPLRLALAASCSFVAQGFSGDARGLSRLFEAAVRHRGFALVNVFSPCVTFNKLNTYEFFREHLVSLEERGHDPGDRLGAQQLLDECDDLVLGLLYREERVPYHEAILGATPGPASELDLVLNAEQRRGLLGQFL